MSADVSRCFIGGVERNRKGHTAQPFSRHLRSAPFAVTPIVTPSASLYVPVSREWNGGPRLMKMTPRQA